MNSQESTTEGPAEFKKSGREMVSVSQEKILTERMMSTEAECIEVGDERGKMNQE